jgi:AcrR family transcriptional regulator
MSDRGTGRLDGAPALHEVVASNTALRLLLAAERLFARHGIDGVSLRQIAAAAGTSNNSAVRYHFGTKADLLAAIFTYRLDELTRRRSVLVERADPDDLRARVEAHLLPLVELAEAPDTHYVGFVEQLQRSGALDVFVAQGAVRRSHDRFLADMRRLLTALPEPARSMRIAHVQDLCVHLAAERERAVDRGGVSVPLALYVSAAVDGIAGFLAAPASPETIELLARHRRARPRAGLRLV